MCTDVQKQREFNEYGLIKTAASVLLWRNSRPFVAEMMLFVRIVFSFPVHFFSYIFKIVYF